MDPGSAEIRADGAPGITASTSKVTTEIRHHPEHTQRYICVRKL
jgi:hypothetical protein